MKNLLLLGIALVFSTLSIHAQIDPFEDDMESYVVGQPIFEEHWTDWGCGGGAGCAIMASNTYAHDGSQSGLIPGDGTTDAVLDLGNKIFDIWFLEFYMYIPEGKEGYFNLQGEVPIGAGEWIVGNIYFNQDGLAPGTGVIDDAVGAPVNFSYPEDQWFRIVMSWNIENGISLATWDMSVNNVMVIPEDTPFTKADGTPPTSLGGIDFWSGNTNHEFYLDSFEFMDELIINYVEDFNSKEFVAFPNPVKDKLSLSANEEISSISITNILGQEIYSQNINALNASIDMSSFSKGTYFINAIIGDTTGTIKIIK